MLEQLAVKLEAHGGDVPALLRAEEVARAADFQIAHGDLEAAAQRRVLLDGAHALAGVREQTRVSRHEQIGEGLMLVAPHPAPQLIQLAQAEAVRAVDDDRVRVRDVDAALDDRRAEQHICLAVDEFRHHFLEIIRVHLAVSDGESRLRHQHPQPRRDALDIEHAIVQIEDLSAAVQLAQDRVANHPFVELSDDGLHGQPILRRRLDGAHVARARQREMQRARDGRGAEREHVHELAQQLELLLVHHAEALFLVDDHEAKLLERDVVLHEAVRADDDVHRAGRQILNDLARLAGGPVTRQHFDANRVIRHAFAEGVEVLLRQHRGRHEDGHLPPIHHRLERRANRHLRLAVANVAADEPVHRLRSLHVALGGVDGTPLMRRFLIEKGTLELPLPRRVRLEGVSRLRGTSGLDGEQLPREIAHGALGVFLGLLPAPAAERVEGRTRLPRADVFADEMRLADRDVKFRRRLVRLAWRVFDDEAFLLRVGRGRGLLQLLHAASDRHHPQAEVTADALLEVHDVIALLQVSEINLQQRTRRLRVRRLEPARTLHLVTPEDFRVRDDDELRRFAEEAP